MSKPTIAGLVSIGIFIIELIGVGYEIPPFYPNDLSIVVLVLMSLITGYGIFLGIQQFKVNKPSALTFLAANFPLFLSVLIILISLVIKIMFANFPDLGKPF